MHNFVHFWVRRNFLNFVKHFLCQFRIHLGFLVNSANEIYEILISLFKKHRLSMSQWCMCSFACRVDMHANARCVLTDCEQSCPLVIESLRTNVNTRSDLGHSQITWHEMTDCMWRCFYPRRQSDAICWRNLDQMGPACHSHSLQRVWFFLTLTLLNVLLWLIDIYSTVSTGMLFLLLSLHRPSRSLPFAAGGRSLPHMSPNL